MRTSLSLLIFGPPEAYSGNIEVGSLLMLPFGPWNFAWPKNLRELSLPNLAHLAVPPFLGHPRDSALLQLSDPVGRLRAEAEKEEAGEQRPRW